MSGLSPEVLAVAEAQAARDRDLLAQLVREGKVMRSEDRTGRLIPRRARTSERFIADIEARVTPRRAVNLAIRPRRKRR